MDSCHFGYICRDIGTLIPLRRWFEFVREESKTAGMITSGIVRVHLIHSEKNDYRMNLA